MGRAIAIIGVLVLVANCGCVRHGREFQIIDAETRGPLSEVHVSRYSSRNYMLYGFSDDRGTPTATDASGRARTGSLNSRYRSYIFRFDREGYSPAVVEFAPTNPTFEWSIFSPWINDNSTRRIAPRGDRLIVPLKPLPKDLHHISTLATLPPIPDKWDGIWRMQAVHTDTGLPMSDVTVTYYQPLFGYSLNEILTANKMLVTTTTDENGVVASKVIEGVGANVVFSKEGYWMTVCNVGRDTASVWVAAGIDQAGSAKHGHNALSPRNLITVPMYEKSTSFEQLEEKPR